MLKSMPTRTEAIKRFLLAKSRKDLSILYNHNMECQVNVAQDGGERVDSEFQGRPWQGWTDGVSTWKSFRIPYKASTEPEYQDKEMSFDLAAHVEAVGMTGWDWLNRCSRWVAYDFDAIIGHSDKHASKLSNEELEAVKKAAWDIEWATIRKSTSGTGLHLYVYLPAVPTANHAEHAALARAILGRMSALTGFDFHSKVDNCGGNMWVWHRKMEGTDGLTLLKQGSQLTNIPANWKDHIKVITGNRRKNLPQSIEDSGHAELFEEIVSQRPNIPLDEDHKKLINYLKDNNALWWWDQDHHMLVTHTHWLQKASEDLNFKGIFKTNSDATNLNEQNCYAMPLRHGAWVVRRYTPGVQEHSSWDQDGAGWTRCYLNHKPTIITAAKTFGGLEDPKGGFIFREAEIAEKAAQLLGVHFKIDPALRSRETKLKQHKDGRLIAVVERKEQDLADNMQGWLPQKSEWIKIFNTSVDKADEPEAGNYDDLIRHLVTETNEDYGWMIKSDGRWRMEPLVHVRVALGSLGLKQQEINTILGSSIFKCWKVVNKPFQPEYPGDREWNRNAAQLRYLPTQNSDKLRYPTWTKILTHCGAGLDTAIKVSAWCKANGILTGGDYLKCWVASLLQEPLEPLPYLFLYGPQNSGKSILHEALSLLFTVGYKRADAALISSSGFNGELEGAILCVIEETDLRRNQQAYNRIKDWVTSRELLIHCKGKTPYHIPNSTHFVHAANDHQACPIFPGDTRITMCYVDLLDPTDLIPKKQLIPMLEKEAPDFLAEVLKLELPPSNDRLNIPVIATEDKHLAQEMNQTDLERFIGEKCVYAIGHCIKFSELYERFTEWLGPTDVRQWSKIRVGRSLPAQYPKGRSPKDGQHYIGNVTWSGIERSAIEVLPKLVIKDSYLIPLEQ